jgi:hypothetical protein
MILIMQRLGRCFRHLLVSFRERRFAGVISFRTTQRASSNGSGNPRSGIRSSFGYFSDPAFESVTRCPMLPRRTESMMGVRADDWIAFKSVAELKGRLLTVVTVAPAASPARKAGPSQTTEQICSLSRTCKPMDRLRSVTSASSSSCQTASVGVDVDVSCQPVRARQAVASFVRKPA